MKMYHHPDYSDLLGLRLAGLDDPNAAAEFERLRAYLARFTPPEGLEIKDSKVPSLYGEHEIDIRIYKMADTPAGAPLILNIHGGGYVAGTLDNDNKRCSYIATHMPSIIVSVGYRLAPACIFPGQLEDCYSVLRWMLDNADTLGGSADLFGIQGISAGGNMAAGLTLQLRDRGEPLPGMTFLNIPGLSMTHTFSREQTRDGAPVLDGADLFTNQNLYVGGMKGTPPSYYAVPLTCPSFQGLPPHFIIAAEYDPLRDEAVQYAQRLMAEAVPTELHVLPRVPHGYDMVSEAPMTKWIYDGVCASYTREFDRIRGMSI